MFLAAPFLSCLLSRIKIEQVGVIPKTTYQMEAQVLGILE
jgi:hypothetical protein